MLGSTQIGLAVNNAPSFLPTDVPGCQLWLRGDLGASVGAGNLTALLDQSGNNRHPTVVGAIPYVPSSINGQAGFTLDGTTNLANTVANALSGSTPRTIFVVCRASSNEGGPLFENRVTEPNATTYFYAGPGYTVGNVALTDGAQGFFYASALSLSGVDAIVEFSSGVLPSPCTIRVNGVTRYSGGSLNAETAAPGYHVGRWTYFGSTNGFKGDIDEVVVHDSIHAGASRASLAAYFLARYGLPI